LLALMPRAAKTRSPAPTRSRPAWAGPLAVFVAVVLVYLPALGNGFVWNDVDYVTKPALRSLSGLWRIWFEVGSTEQYYPLLHSFFWLQQWVFHDAPFGYHLVNVLLHASCAALLVLVVRRLFETEERTGGGAGIRDAGLPASQTPGSRPAGNTVALLAGLIFAVHPVYVESVAWISEQKNTFSLFWYLLAGWVYLGIDRGRADLPSPPHDFWRNRRYWLATFFFLLAILSKSLTASLPAVLLVLTWWRRGRLPWSCWVPLLPWVACGAAMGLFTGWVEHHWVGAQGEDFALGVVERGVLAGRVIWFYLGKYFWPAELIFIYPRWTVDLAVWWQWLFPAAAVGLLAWCLVLSRRMRGPLAGLLIFVGTLVPTIGFFNVYAFKFSYVADHWNYLPSVALAVVAAWGAVALAGWIEGRVGSTTRPGSNGAIAAGSSSQPYLWTAAPVILLLLAGLSWRQCAGYGDLETFYRTILRENPDCWLALNNMGLLELNRNQPQAAIPYFEQTLRFRPKDPEPENNLGAALQRLGRNREAIPHFEAAIRKWPDYANAYYNLGNAQFNEGRVADAVASFAASIRIDPRQTGARHNLGIAYLQLGRNDDAVAQFEQALAVRPDYPEAHHSLGLVLARLDRGPQALPHLRQAAALRPDSVEWQLDLALALTGAGQLNEAIAVFQRAQALRPDSSEVRLKFAATLLLAGRETEAVEQNREGRRLRDLGR
jgi:tetratricopeptide (TPR) repeat protein